MRVSLVRSTSPAKSARHYESGVLGTPVDPAVTPKTLLKGPTAESLALEAGDGKEPLGRIPVGNSWSSRREKE